MTTNGSKTDLREVSRMAHLLKILTQPVSVFHKPLVLFMMVVFHTIKDQKATCSSELIKCLHIL